MPLCCFQNKQAANSIVLAVAVSRTACAGTCALSQWTPDHGILEGGKRHTAARIIRGIFVALHWGKAAKGGHSDDIERPPRPHDAVCEVLPAEAEAMYQRIVQGRVVINAKSYHWLTGADIATVRAN